MYLCFEIERGIDSYFNFENKGIKKILKLNKFKKLLCIF